MSADEPRYRSVDGVRRNPLRRPLEPSRGKLLRQLALFACGVVPGWVFGCTAPPPTMQQVLAGQITVAAGDRQALENLLQTNGIGPQDLAILKEGNPEGRGSFARLEGERVVSLRLEQVHAAESVERLTQLRELHLEGDLEAFSLQGLAALEFLTLTQPQETLRSLELSNLASLQTLVVNGGELDDGLHLEGLPSLGNLGLNNCGLHRAPQLSGLPLTDLNLAGNQIRDLAPLATIPDLVSLHLSSNGISSLETLPPLPSLRALYLGHNPLSPDLQLVARDYPHLKTLDLRFTGLTHPPPGLEGMPVKWDEGQTQKMEFHATLERLRASHRAAAGELVARLGDTGGKQFDTAGRCQWKTGSHHRAKVDCRLRIASLRGLSAAKLGTTDPAFPFQGGGNPQVRAELSVEEGTAALYLRQSFDLVAMAQQLSGLPAELAEAARQPDDRFDGYRRLEARPGAPARLEGEPSLLASRVVLWIEAEQEARSLTLVVESL